MTDPALTGSQSPEFVTCMMYMLPQEDPVPLDWYNRRNYSNTPGDPGGATMDGIIQTEYDRYRTRRGLPRQPVINITQAEGYDIYYNNYWLPYCPGLPRGFDLQFFDTSVNEGTGRAVQILQYALGTPTDGLWGPLTQAKVDAIADVGAAIRAFGNRRAAVYRTFGGFGEFGVDWERRTAEITTEALKMASGV